MDEQEIRRVFGVIWPKFLEFEISRSRNAIRFIGNANAYLVFQVIAYHSLSSLIDAHKSNEYETIREAWEKGETSNLSHLPQKLSYASISDITELDKETVRRIVKKFIKDGWVKFSKEKGIYYSANDDNEKKLLSFNEWEINEFGRLFALFNRLINKK